MIKQLAAVALLALLSACSSTTPATPAAASSPAVAGPTLAGTSWTVSKIKDADTLAGHQPSMAFDEGKVSGLASCNRFTGGYTLSGAQLKFGTLATTAMMCTDNAVMTQEQSFLAAVDTVASVRTAGTGVELLNAQQKVMITLAPVENKPLESTVWKLSGVVSNEAVTSATSDGSTTITIAGGQLTGKTCNTFGGSVETDDNGSFKVGPLRSTKMACSSKELTTEETAVLAALAKVTSYEISGSALTLKAADGTGLEFLAG